MSPLSLLLACNFRVVAKTYKEPYLREEFGGEKIEVTLLINQLLVFYSKYSCGKGVCKVFKPN
jgi:hypothetical protein